ncbi:MAG: ABC transporter substrate-binding protein [Gammaproteobacteria bacterium]|nr:ABC transporter substrate-binding protein [Gammaproteobacteria bacterium]
MIGLRLRQVWVVALAVFATGGVGALADTPPGAPAAMRERVRIGVLAFGTVSWELAAIDAEGSAGTASIDLLPTVLAGAEAAKIALQGSAVDLIVADWIWVARQRAQGSDYTFAPYSTVHGALVVPSDSPIRDVGDLEGKKLGVVGGGLDKNWLMLRLLAQRKFGFDAQRAVSPVFGAPPLLNQQLVQGRLDALLNYWHYAVKLEARGYRTILDGRMLLRELGVADDLANLGFVFRDSWARQHLPALRATLEVFGRAHRRLCEDDALWQRVLPLTQERDPKVTGLLRQRYCSGGVGAPPERQAEAAARLFGLLREVAGEELTGAAAVLPPGTFWSVPK